MKKQKTRKSLIKRVKITAKGKLLRGSQYSRHRKAHKSKRRIRTYGRLKQLTKKQARTVKRFINK